MAPPDGRRWTVVGTMGDEIVSFKSNKRKKVVRIRRSRGTEWIVPRNEFFKLIESTGAKCRVCRGGKLESIDMRSMGERLAMFLVCGSCGRYHKLIDGKPYLYTSPEYGLALLFGELGHRV